jgi:hypothetical protein
LPTFFVARKTRPVFEDFKSSLLKKSVGLEVSEILQLRNGMTFGTMLAIQGYMVSLMIPIHHLYKRALP